MINNTVIGVDVGGTSIVAGRIDSGVLTDQCVCKISADSPEEIIINEIIDSINKVNNDSVSGIGVGVPSLVDSDKGIVYDVQNIPSWKEVFLKDRLEKVFNKPVYVNNDANCFAVGEKYFDKGKKYHSMVGLTLGTGLGTGIILEDKLYSGKYCGAGEFGSIKYLDATFEDYCSGKFFLQEYNVKGCEVAKRAENSDEKAIEMFNEFGVHLGEAIKCILFALSPEAIIIGGSISKSYEFYKETMWKTIKSFPYKKITNDLVIEITMHPNIAIYGAAALYYDAIGVQVAV